MSKNVDHDLFQSGERIRVSGEYTVVGTCPSKRWFLRAGGYFPNHDGRAVIWHFESYEQSTLTHSLFIADRGDRMAGDKPAWSARQPDK